MSADARQTPVKGRRYLPLETTKVLVANAIGPAFGYPLCDHLAASHAAGVSTACLLARAMRANIGFLQDQVDVSRGELLREGDFTPDKLREHIDIAFVLNALLFVMTADRALFSVDRQNIVAKAFANLPQEVLQPYNEGILRIRHVLDDEILGPMMELDNRIEEQGGLECEQEVESLLMGRVLGRLSEMYRRLGELGECVERIAESIKADWECDLNQILADEH
jgi:predicted Zn-dependent protease with MMP-like domain